MDESKVIAIIASIVVVIVLFFVPIIMYFGAHNNEVSLRNQFTAQQNINVQVFDNVWKVIEQQTDVAVTERETFKETFTEIMNSQEGIAGKGSLASFFTQAKVDVSPDLYKKLMTSIEAQRGTFLDSQRRLLDIKKSHDDILTRYPSAFFVGGRPALNPVLVNSSKTQDIFNSGVEDDVTLFKD